MNKDYVVYPAVFDNIDNDGYYTVTFPDIPNTVTQGKTIEEAMKNAPDALAIALPDYKEYPEPTAIKTVQKNNPDKIVSYVAIDMKKYLKKFKSQTVRKNVTIPSYLADEAKAQNINFSAVLTRALKEKLGE
ncbi:MAG: type II toxin-antitoxin system HicB family antitoxin [Lactobacillus sp.]|jgi:predicted RNase H-like HicB family nuclease|nr:type II toxin-antitoxin system HicB family antitoxin [Lactobacillus sp.]